MDFSKEILEAVNNREYNFYKLYINDTCKFDEFENAIRSMPREIKSLKSIYAYMDDFSSHIILPRAKFRQILEVNRKDVFEFKKDNVRVYIVLNRPDIFVITGGFKNNQKKDIKNIKKDIKNFDPNSNIENHG